VPGHATLLIVARNRIDLRSGRGPVIARTRAAMDPDRRGYAVAADYQEGGVTGHKRTVTFERVR